MTAAVYCPTRVLSGLGAVRTWGADNPDVTVVVDPAIAAGAWGDRLRTELARQWPSRDWIVADPAALNIAAVVALAERISGVKTVLGVGGGTVMDLIKLASAVVSSRDTLLRLSTSDRCGLVLLPAAARGGNELWLVPTTLGTGAELSAVACLSTGRGKKLVLGEGLRPDGAVLDPVATATLPYGLVAEGVLEVLFRVTGPYLGDATGRLVPDALAETLAARLIGLGDQAASGHLNGETRLAIAEASAFSHSGWVHPGRDPFSAKGWYLAAELSGAVGCRKNTALAVLLPALWRAIFAGDKRWGSARRLAVIWQRMREGSAVSLPSDPVAGISQVLGNWRIPRRIPSSPDTAEEVARRTARAWGGGLPMLGALGAQDLRAVLADAFAGVTP
jgi:alcohol dehydrogenase YqhD (iron-dependent ADH family)